MPRLVPLVVLLLMPIFALAANSCANAVTTVEIDECISTDFTALDAKLNQVYSKLIRELSKPAKEYENRPATKKLLIAAQRHWVGFREKDCEARYKFHEAGTIRNAMHFSCLIGHTEQRIKNLEQYLKEFQ